MSYIAFLLETFRQIHLLQGPGVIADGGKNVTQQPVFPGKVWLAFPLGVHPAYLSSFVSPLKHESIVYVCLGRSEEGMEHPSGTLEGISLSSTSPTYLSLWYPVSLLVIM